MEEQQYTTLHGKVIIFIGYLRQRFIKKYKNYLKSGHLDVAKYLVKTGADIEAIDNYGETALDLAIQNGNTETTIGI